MTFLESAFRSATAGLLPKPVNEKVSRNTTFSRFLPENHKSISEQFFGKWFPPLKHLAPFASPAKQSGRAILALCTPGQYFFDEIKRA